MIYTTYAMIDDGSGDNAGLITQLEGLTGNRVAYGVNTPISYTDIVNTCGTSVALALIPYAVQDYVATAQLIGVEMVKSQVDIWNSIFPDDSRPNDLLYYLELVISGQNTVLPNRTDYCGNDLGGSTLIPDSQLQDIIDNLGVKIDGLDYTGHFTSYVLYIANDTGPINAATLASWRSVGGNPPSVTITDDDVANPIIDRSQSLITGMTGYIERPIATAIAMDQYMSDVFTYDESQSPYYYKVTYHRADDFETATGLSSYENMAAKWFYLALRLATLQVIGGTGVNLAAIYTYLRSARADYNNFRQQEIRPLLTSINQMRTGLSPLADTGDEGLDTAGQVVEDAGLNRRAELLRDPVYVAQFDTNASGSLNTTERIALENAVNAEMRIAREAAVTTYVASYQAQFDAFSGSSDTLGNIVILYTA